jgi:hypothetical protein
MQDSKVGMIISYCIAGRLLGIGLELGSNKSKCYKDAHLNDFADSLVYRIQRESNIV